MILLLLFPAIMACQGQQKKNANDKTQTNMRTPQEHTYSNHLINESSPYLLQHAHNPVDWYPWGDEAFEKAKREDKLVLVSIGYSACHWCHVMEKESFEDEETARLMNDNFVCIKVDREERPDVDHQYMDAVQLLTGRGGWPLNCFTLPDGRPVWGGTYFNNSQWKSVLEQLAGMYKNNRQPLLDQAKQLEEGIKSHNLVTPVTNEKPFSTKELQQAVDQWKNKFDKQWGGNKGAPKFPLPVKYEFLLDYVYHTDDETVSRFIQLTLDKMAMGGIYDQIGGGFARYSTDEQWIVPHFEKMLYDNAQLIGLYSNAYRMWHKPEYKTVVYQTVGFLTRELRSDRGAFYSSLDADSDGAEGRYYVWTKQEIDTALGDQAPLFEAAYSVTENGNWEKGKNILFRSKPVEKIAVEFNLTSVQVQHQLDGSEKKLMAIREQRIRPLTDTKILTSWNALTITGLTEAYRAFDDNDFLNPALTAARFIRDNRMEKSGKLVRAAKNKNTMIPAFMDDYAATSRAFINLYQVTFDEQWLNLAAKITQYGFDHFFDETSGLFGYTAKESQLVTGTKTETTDNVIPSSNAMMATVLHDLGIYFDNKHWREVSENMLRTLYENILQSPGYHSQWGLLLNHYLFPDYEIVFTGPNAQELKRRFDAEYVPALVAGSENPSRMPLLEDRVIQGETLIYVCKNQSCKLPVKTLQEALQQMEVKYIRDKTVHQ